MEYYNDVLAVGADWLIENGVITGSNYRNLTYRRHVNVVRRPGPGSPALISYESLPEVYRQDVARLLGGDPHESARGVMIERYIRHNGERSRFFEEYRLADGRGLKADVRRRYYADAIVLDAVGALMAEKVQKRHSMGVTCRHDWRAIAEGVQELDRVKYPHSLPANGRKLREKFREYSEKGPASLVSKKFLNKNTAKINDSVKESFLIELLADPRNLNNEQIARLYNCIAEEMGWKTIAGAAVARWRERFGMEILAGRRGSLAFSNEKAMQVKRKAPDFPLYYWTMDGWDVELLYQKNENGTTTYHHRPTVVVVLDACGKYPVGYAVGTHETPELIRAALRNAARHTAELFGEMYRTAQLQSDHYSLKKMTPLYEGISEKVTPARVKNAKAKVVEPYFVGINRGYCQLQKNWSGFGVTSRKENQPNVEYLNKYRHDFPDFAGVCRQVDGIIASERAAKVARYKELFAGMPAENKTRLSLEGYLLLFGSTTGRRNLLQGSGLNVTIGGVARDYDCFDLQFRQHASVRWEVRYDPDDLSRALAVNEDESLRFLLEEKYVQPMALKERKEGDYEQLRRVEEYNERLRQSVIEFREKSGDVVRREVERNPELETLGKLMIVDSAGQHKNRRNEARAIPETTNVEDATEIDIYGMY
jgi:hypothetical protein